MDCLQLFILEEVSFFCQEPWFWTHFLWWVLLVLLLTFDTEFLIMNQALSLQMQIEGSIQFANSAALRIYSLSHFASQKQSLYLSICLFLGFVFFLVKNAASLCHRCYCRVCFIYYFLAVSPGVQWVGNLCAKCWMFSNANPAKNATCIKGCRKLSEKIFGSKSYIWLKRERTVANGKKDNKVSEISETWETSKSLPVAIKGQVWQKKYWDYIPSLDAE